MLMRPDLKTLETNAIFRRLGEIDWDFTAQVSESPFSSLHWHPCRFPSQIPALAIGRMCPQGGLVLDPFMGSATTLVEAQRLGRESIGIDVNPVSCQMARAKTLVSSLTEIRAAVNALKLRLRSNWDVEAAAPLPPSVQADKWYMPNAQIELRRLWTICSESIDISSTISRACFSAILMPACREDRHWGYICDNTNPKGTRSTDCRELFISALDRLLAAYIQRSEEAVYPLPTATVMHSDCYMALRSMPDEVVDFVVTSPPYFGVADYVKSQRLMMEWLECEIEPLRKQEIGARSKRHRQSAFDDYQSELARVFAQVHRVMKPGALGIVVFGQSPSRRDAYLSFIENLQALNFSIPFERKRNIAVGRRQMPSLVQEMVIVLQK